ncbi:MAG: carbamate kinase, partial [Clostridium sp.]
MGVINMSITKVVVALGGNALQEPGSSATAQAQLEVVKKTAEFLAELSCTGYELAVVHGNGPQVGRIVLAFEAAANVTPVMPFDVCGAMSQGYIGYHIQQGLRYALAKRNRNIPVVSLVTQVVVDKNDPAFQNPTKPIGAFYTEEEAKKIETEQGFTMKEDAGRGYRRVVASPVPKRIIELSAVKALWDTTIVVAAGGGGIPVIEKEDGSLEGVAAVIDKDLAAERLAEDIGADALMILTEVEKVSINYKMPNQIDLGELSVADAEKYIDQGHFAPGSMLPKMQAAVMFAKANPGKRAIITSLFKGVEALQGK